MWIGKNNFNRKQFKYRNKICLSFQLSIQSQKWIVVKVKRE